MTKRAIHDLLDESLFAGTWHIDGFPVTNIEIKPQGPESIEQLELTVEGERPYLIKGHASLMTDPDTRSMVGWVNDLVRGRQVYLSVKARTRVREVVVQEVATGGEVLENEADTLTHWVGGDERGQAGELQDLATDLSQDGVDGVDTDETSALAAALPEGDVVDFGALLRQDAGTRMDSGWEGPAGGQTAEEEAPDEMAQISENAVVRDGQATGESAAENITIEARRDALVSGDATFARVSDRATQDAPMVAERGSVDTPLAEVDPRTAGETVPDPGERGQEIIDGPEAQGDELTGGVVEAASEEAQAGEPVGEDQAQDSGVVGDKRVGAKPSKRVRKPMPENVFQGLLMAWTFIFAPLFAVGLVNLCMATEAEPFGRLPVFNWLVVGMIVLGYVLMWLAPPDPSLAKPSTPTPAGPGTGHSTTKGTDLARTLPSTTTGPLPPWATPAQQTHAAPQQVEVQDDWLPAGRLLLTAEWMLNLTWFVDGQPVEGLAVNRQAEGHTLELSAGQRKYLVAGSAYLVRTEGGLQGQVEDLLTGQAVVLDLVGSL